MVFGSYLDPPTSEAKDVIRERHEFAQVLRNNLLQAQQRMKFFADRKRSEREFQVGDKVYLKLQPFKQNSVSLRKNLKLSSRYYGPYSIIEKVGAVAYKLDLPDTSRIHPVFHVSLLKKCIGEKNIPSTELPETDTTGQFKIEPSAVLDSRSIIRKGESVSQILVKWLNAGPEFATWEDAKHIRRKFPSFDPWGQGSSPARGIVMGLHMEVGDKVESCDLAEIGLEEGIGDYLLKGQSKLEVETLPIHVA